MPYFGIFSLEFWKAIVILEINTAELILQQSFVQKPRVPYLNVLGSKF